MAKYEIELWNKDGEPIGDIMPFCTNFSWSKTLNDSGQVNITVDINRFGEWLKSIGYGSRPYEILEIGRTDIRIKRNGVYIIGANVAQLGYSANENSVSVAIAAYEYINYYKYRYYTGSFTNTNQADILWSVINSLNSVTGGDYGVRRGATYGAAVKRDRTYDKKEVKSLFTQMSDVLEGVDFEITPDKKLNIWNGANNGGARKGVFRPDVFLTYPGNIKGFSFYRTGSKVSNFVIAKGTDITSTAEDTLSENYLYRREKLVTYNSVSTQSVLDQHANAVLHYTKDIIEIPQVTVRDGVIDLSVVDTGDTITLNMDGDIALKNVTGSYRIESISCSIDDNGAEEVSLTFDDIDISQIINQQQEA